MGLSFSPVILGSTVRCYAMEFLIIGLFAAIVAFLIWRSKQNTDPKEQACAIEIGNLLKANPDARPQAVADVFIKHGIRSEEHTSELQSRPHLVCRLLLEKKKKKKEKKQQNK